MSEFPTCKEHGLLKPCSHCEPPKYVETFRTCSDVDKGDKLVRCDCGAFRAEYRGHDQERPRGRSWY